MLKIRRPLGRLIFNMGIDIPGKTVFLIETAPCHPAACLCTRPNDSSWQEQTARFTAHLTHWDGDKMAAISQMTFSSAFYWMKCIDFDQQFIAVCSLWSNWWYSGTGSDNGLAPTRRPAIIWTNDDLDYRSIYVSLRLNKLTLYTIGCC